MDELIKAGLSQGLGYGMFVCLFVYVLKTTKTREENYQNLLNKMTDKFNILEDVEKDVKEIRRKIER